jgi:hypothetical protein
VLEVDEGEDVSGLGGLSYWAVDWASIFGEFLFEPVCVCVKLT